MYSTIAHFGFCRSLFAVQIVHIQKELQKDVETEVAKTQVHHARSIITICRLLFRRSASLFTSHYRILRVQREYFLNEQLKKIKQELGH